MYIPGRDGALLMRRSLKLAVVLCGAVVATIALATEEQLSEVPWKENIPAALAEAKRTGRPVLVNIWAAWCKPCKMMEETTYRDPDVRQAIENFVPLKVNADLQQAFIRRYRVHAYPTVLVLDGDGEEITRWIGLVAAPVMLDSLEQVLMGYAGPD